MIGDMAAVHMTESEVARDLKAVLEKVQRGIEVVIEKDNQPIAVIKSPQRTPRTISDAIAIAEQRERDRGYPVTLDPDFAADVEEIVHRRRPWNPPSWG